MVRSHPSGLVAQEDLGSDACWMTEDSSTQAPVSGVFERESHKSERDDQ